MKFPSLKNKILVVLLVLAIIFFLNVFQKPVRGFFYFISSPFQSFLWEKGSGTSDFFSSLFENSYLKQANRDLEAQNYAFRAKLVELQSVQNENSQLRQALGLGFTKDFQTVSAHMVGKNPTEDIITITKGKDAGLAQGMPVITSSKVLVGKIVEVFGTVSNVMLVSDVKSSFDVKINDKEISGLLKGQGRFSALLDLIPKGSNPAQGDVVVTTSMGGIFPKNLLVGSIKTVKTNDIEPFQSAIVAPFFNMNSGQILFVIIQGQ